MGFSGIRFRRCPALFFAMYFICGTPRRARALCVYVGKLAYRALHGRTIRFQRFDYAKSHSGTSSQTHLMCHSCEIDSSCVCAFHRNQDRLGRLSLSNTSSRGKIFLGRDAKKLGIKCPVKLSDLKGELIAIISHPRELSNSFVE